MKSTPPEVVQYLQQLEPILTRWYIDGKLGEVATIFGRNELQAEERPKHVTVKVRLKRSFSRAKLIDTSKW